MARYLHTTPRTVARWRAAGDAPRAVQLALFWESRWGRSLTETDAHNAATVHAAHAASLGREVDRLRTVIQRLESAQGWASANSPIYTAA